MLSSEERIRAATVNADRTREQITLTEAMVEAGRTARVELLDIRSQLAREEYDIITAENQYQQASLRMAQLPQLTPQEAASFSITAPTLKDFRPEAPIATVEQVMQRVLATPGVQAAPIECGECGTWSRDRTCRRHTIVALQCERGLRLFRTG
ncbi:MAG: TolC family protein [Flavobacteriales bacterium]|nr:TolC family protein [Flavobacteriales bacterium]